MYIHVYTCNVHVLYVYIYIYTPIYMYIHVYVQVLLPQCLYMYMYMYMRIYMYIYVCSHHLLKFLCIDVVLEESITDGFNTFTSIHATYMYSTAPRNRTDCTVCGVYGDEVKGVYGNLTNWKFIVFQFF